MAGYRNTVARFGREGGQKNEACLLSNRLDPLDPMTATDQAFERFLPNNPKPVSPEPRSKRVAGSGTGALPLPTGVSGV